MDDEETASYRQPCAQCAAVNWGLTEEGCFYCRSCHNVIERQREVQDEATYVPGSSQVSTISRRSRRSRARAESVQQWAVCEGFQFILCRQADALLALGVNPSFKDQVLLQLWRRYLQQSHQAYTNEPLKRPRTQNPATSDSESALDSFSEGEMSFSTDAASGSEGRCPSGSEDGGLYWKTAKKLMNMMKTLALIHLALTWSREALTLSDLLRLVREGHVPYITAYQELPEEMKLLGRDSSIFRNESFPTRREVHSEAQDLICLLQLPAFPPITQQCLLHPALLSLRYLSDANLPDQLHPWVCQVMELLGLGAEPLLTVDFSTNHGLPSYELQAAALIIITMKLLYGLDDITEWDLSNQTSDDENSGQLFNLRRWYRLLQPALLRAQSRAQLNRTRTQWKGRRPLVVYKMLQRSATKRKRVAEQISSCFQRLGSSGSDRVQLPSSFTFRWGLEGDGAEVDGPSMHHLRLEGVVAARGGVLTSTSTSYWYPVLCKRLLWKASFHFKELSSFLPSSFLWLLELFSFLLGVKPPDLFQEVRRLENLLLSLGPGSRLARGSGSRPEPRNQSRTTLQSLTKDQVSDQDKTLDEVQVPDLDPGPGSRPRPEST